MGSAATASLSPPSLPANADAERAHRKWILFVVRGVSPVIPNDIRSPTSARDHRTRKDKAKGGNKDKDSLRSSSNTVHHSSLFIKVFFLQVIPKISNAKIMKRNTLSNSNLQHDTRDQFCWG